MFNFALPLLYLTWCQVASAAVDAVTQQTCKEIANFLPRELVMPGTKAYRTETANYWSTTQMERRPACIAMPTTADGVSVVVSILNKQPTVKFAVKSGGHSPNLDFNSVQDGVLLSLANLKGAILSPDQNVAYVKPGGDWNTVLGDLAPSGKAVVGGRLGVVGVGGYITGGGLSFLSAQYGMAADTVTNFETVMANGSIVNVNAQTNPDLLVAMRGGGNQYGIVTKFTMQALPVSRTWGGTRAYSGSQRNQLLEAFVDFTLNPPDAKAAVILTLERFSKTDLIVLFMFYDGETPPKGAFGKFESISASLDLTKPRLYKDLLSFNGNGAREIPFSRYNFRMMTLPLPPAPTGANFAEKIADIWAKKTDEWQEPFTTRSISLASLALQSFPALIGKQTAKNGGNAMGLGDNDHPRFMLEFTDVFGSLKDSPLVWQKRRETVSQVEALLNSTKANMDATTLQAIEANNPFFMNDAAFDQDVYGSYKDVEKFKRLQKEVDPTGFWRRAGGFKFSE